MAILDGEWWGPWWPWLLVWAVTAGLLATAVTQIVRAIRRAQPAHPHTHGSVFYLDDSYVMDLYRMHGGKYKAALLQEVEERIIETRETELSAEQAPVKLGRRQGINSDVFRKYVEKAEPITVLSIVMDVLDRADDIVEVNLGNQTVTGNHALAAALDIVDSRLPATVVLSKVDAFLSVRGEFQITDTAETTVTLAAGHVRLTCVRANIRDTDLPATFRARCLARPQEWTADGQLKLRPVAIFR